MRKVVSYLLAALVLLNVLGYYGLFLGLKYQQAETMTEQFDENRYRDSETITLKVPVSIPYLQNTDFERVDGEFEHNGEFFRLVKQKFANDTLYIVCVNDVHSKNIKQVLAEYVKTFSDQPLSSKPSTLVPSLINDYLLIDFSIGTSSDGWTLISFLSYSNEDLTCFPSISITSPPPEA